MQNFETDLFMMVPIPSEANLKGGKPKYVACQVAKKFAVETGFPWVEGV